jgi:antitoxin MazE
MAVSDELTKMTRNGQVTLPASIRRAAQLEEGDFFSVRFDGDNVVLTPKKLIDKSQAYYWTAEWQEKERRADEDIRAGRVKRFASVEELLADLDSSEPDDAD